MIDPTEFITRLSLEVTESDAFNQYVAGDNSDNAIRRANLSRYLEVMSERRPRVMLIAEAPGYRGMRLTGVPMTSRRLLSEGIPDLNMFGKHNGYQDVNDTGFESISGEQSATILWRQLQRSRVIPLVWNAYPFHPHKSGNLRSNRKPRATEIRQGEPYVRALISHFKPEKVIAVGNVGYDLLTQMGIVCVKVRHPAQGGMRDFEAGLQRELLV